MTNFSIIFGIVISVVLIILAIAWKPSRIAIGSVLMLLGLLFCLTGLGIIIGLPMFFVGVIFLATGLMGKKRVVIELSEKDKNKRESYKEQLPIEPNNTKKSLEMTRGPQDSSQISNLDELEKLASLKDKGIITEEEFNIKKKQILGI